MELFKSKKRLFLGVGLDLFLWAGVTYLLIFMSPGNLYLIGGFLAGLFGALLVGMLLIFRNWRRAITLATYVVVILILRYNGVGNVLNIALLTGAVVFGEIYFLKIDR